MVKKIKEWESVYEQYPSLVPAVLVSTPASDVTDTEGRLSYLGHRLLGPSQVKKCVMMVISQWEEEWETVGRWKQSPVGNSCLGAEAEGQFEVEGGDLSGQHRGMDGNAWMFISTLICGSVLS